MAREIVAAFFEALKKNPQAMEKIRNGIQASEDKDRNAVYTGLAKEMGFEVTGEDLEAFVREEAEKLKEKTDEKIAGLRDLEDEALFAVAGGGASGHTHGEKHPDCKYDFMDMENCYFTDACDNTFLYYSDYLCDWHNYGRDPNVVYICDNNAFEYN